MVLENTFGVLESPGICFGQDSVSKIDSFSISYYRE